MVAGLSVSGSSGRDMVFLDHGMKAAIPRLSRQAAQIEISGGIFIAVALLAFSLCMGLPLLGSFCQCIEGGCFLSGLQPIVAAAHQAFLGLLNAGLLLDDGVIQGVDE